MLIINESSNVFKHILGLFQNKNISVIISTDLLIGADGQLKVVITDVSKLRFLSKTAYIEGWVDINCVYEAYVWSSSNMLI